MQGVVVTGDEDADLVRRLQTGDAGALDALLEKHYGMLYRLAWHWVGQRDDAQDVAQEACIKIACHVGDFRFEAPFRVWVSRLVLNAVRDWQRQAGRRAQREEPLYDDMEWADGAATPEQALSTRQQLKAVSALPDKVKEVVMLVCAQGLSHKEAAHVLGCAETTVSWRLFEARRRLKALGVGGQS